PILSHDSWTTSRLILRRRHVERLPSTLHEAGRVHVYHQLVSSHAHPLSTIGHLTGPGCAGLNEVLCTLLRSCRVLNRGHRAPSPWAPGHDSQSRLLVPDAPCNRTAES